ncbi:chondroitin sulfate synthase 1-like [Pollicipes pollicipes]|uniref:chondroitin sulfate synthase 1-like n=1 Tax=Pollicipes pollicipes TaxID=41117 RepID=UPI001885045C|nr:chondroitin sulfate synthase 1-like [Pollicipes pollicipes]
MRSCRRLNMHWLGCVASTLVGMVLGVHLFLMLQDRPLHRTPRNLQMMATEAASAAVAATARGRVGPSTQPPASDEPGGTDLLFVGVMTADQFLDSRAVAVHETWGQGCARQGQVLHIRDVWWPLASRGLVRAPSIPLPRMLLGSTLQ